VNVRDSEKISDAVPAYHDDPEAEGGCEKCPIASVFQNPGKCRNYCCSYPLYLYVLHGKVIWFIAGRHAVNGANIGLPDCSAKT